MVVLHKSKEALTEDGGELAKDEREEEADDVDVALAHCVGAGQVGEHLGRQRSDYYVQ